MSPFRGTVERRTAADGRWELDLTHSHDEDDQRAGGRAVGRTDGQD